MSTLQNAFGNALYQDLPYMQLGAGIKLPWATILPPTANVAAFVRSTGAADLDMKPLGDMLVTTLDAGLRRVRAGKGDTIYVLPGHTENVTDATMFDNVVAGTRIIGMGSPLQSDAPVFRWTATGSQWTLDQADILIQGLKLRLEGANGVVKAIYITAAGCSLIGNDIEMASGAALKATIGIEVGSAALSTTISGNEFRGTATHNSADGIKVVGATVPSRLKICNNHMSFSATAANGLVHITVAALDMLIRGNEMSNTHTASTACIAIDNVACSGNISYNNMATLNDGTVTDQGLVMAGANSLIKCFENYSCDEKNKSGVLTPAAAT